MIKEEWRVECMEFEEVKKYIDEVKDNPRFKKIDEFTHMTTIKKNQDMYENIQYYLKTYYYRHDCKEAFQPDYEQFMKFLKYYINGEIAEKSVNDRGYLDLSKTIHLIKPRMFCNGSGNFIDNQRMFTDGSVYIAKLPLNYRGNSGISNGYCIYSPLIASYIADTLQIDAAEITLANAHNGNRILSKNFLKPNEEIVTYAEEADEVQISEQLRKLEEALKLRKFPSDEIEQAKIDFLKQEFMAKIIGLKDQSSDNSPVIISTDDTGNKHVRIAPMFDFDYSFHIGEELDYMLVRKCDNGKTDIASFIEQYKDYPGFKEFAIASIGKLDMKRVFERIYEKTGNTEFRDYENNEEMMKFVNYVNRNVEQAREIIAKVYTHESEGR